MTEQSRPTRPGATPPRAPLAARPLSPVAVVPPPLPAATTPGTSAVTTIGEARDARDAKDDRIGRIEARLGDLERERDDTKRRDELRVLLKMALEDALVPVLRWQDAADERYAREQLARSRDPAGAPVVRAPVAIPTAAPPLPSRAVQAEPRPVERSPSLHLDDIPSEMDGSHRRRSAAVWAMAIILIIVSNLATAMIMSRAH